MCHLIVNFPNFLFDDQSLNTISRYKYTVAPVNSTITLSMVLYELKDFSNATDHGHIIK